MAEINLKAVEAKAQELGNDLEAVKKAIKSLQSKKSRLGKQKFRKDYDEQMLKVLADERLLVEVRQLLDPKEKFVTQYEQADVDMLDYDETVKAIKSIQSKKCLCQDATENIEDNVEYQNACRIEKMLQEHRKMLKPTEDCYVRKTDILTVIDTMKLAGNPELDRYVEMLEKLMEQ